MRERATNERARVGGDGSVVRSGGGCERARLTVIRAIVRVWRRVSIRRRRVRASADGFEGGESRRRQAEIKFFQGSPSGRGHEADGTGRVKRTSGESQSEEREISGARAASTAVAAGARAASTAAAAGARAASAATAATSSVAEAGEG